MHPVVTARLAETMCRSQTTPSKTGSADYKLQQLPVIQLPKLGGEVLKGLSSKGSTWQPRTSTPIEGTHSQPAETESMEVDTPAMQATSRDSSASTVAHSAMQRASTSQARPRSTGLHSHLDPKTKQHAMTRQGVRNIVACVLERRGVSQEDWEQSLRTDYRVDTLHPPEWSVHPPPGMYLSTMEGAPLGEWRDEPTVTTDQLLRRLTQLPRGTSQACSYP